MNLDRRSKLAIILLSIGLVVLFILIFSRSVRAETGDTSPTTPAEVTAGTVGGSSVLAGVVSYITSFVKTGKRLDDVTKRLDDSDYQQKVMIGAMRMTSPELDKYLSAFGIEMPQPPKK